MPDTIVMIHGMWGGAWCWDNYQRFFANRGYRCLTPTLRYHDRSPNEPPDPRLGVTSLLDYAADLQREIATLDSVPIIMGHSMGGLLAQILGSHGMATALVLLTPAPPAGIVALRPSVIKAFWSALTRWGFWRKPFRQTYEEAVYSMMHLLPVEQRKQAFNRFVHESGRAACEIGFWFLDSKRAANVDATKLRSPVLVVAGTQDRITPAAIVRKIAKKYEAVSTYKEFPNHAHWLLSEPGWQQTAADIADWLRTTPVMKAESISQTHYHVYGKN